jgi:TRAP-type C4-dicarboxylate transport system substrate-binding protein
MFPAKDTLVESVRMLQAFTNGAKALQEALEQVGAEAERYSRDQVLLAMDNLVKKLKSRGLEVSTEDLAQVMREECRLHLQAHRVSSLVVQAKKRREIRQKGGNPYTAMEDTIKHARRSCNGQ